MQRKHSIYNPKRVTLSVKIKYDVRKRRWKNATNSYNTHFKFISYGASLVTPWFAWLSTETGDYAPLLTAMYILWP